MYEKNAIHDSSYGGGSSEEEDSSTASGGSAAANSLLYVGLGTMAIGLVVAFVGTGEKGFKTVELRLIGPTMIASGFLCCLLRVFLCICPAWCCCCAARRKTPKPTNGTEQTNTTYYKHLPFNKRTVEDFGPVATHNKTATNQTTSANKKKKHVSILPAVASASEPRQIPKIMLPIDASPVLDREETNIIELKPVEQSCSFDDIPSISSEDSFALDQSLSLVVDKPNSGNRDNRSAERLARLKSTLTFGDSLDAGDFATRDHVVSRISEEDSENMDFYSINGCTLNSPLLNNSEKIAAFYNTNELVLTPSQLKNE